MPVPARPHVLAIDDGPFEKGQAGPVPLVAVMMEGADLVESVALEHFPVDGADATGFLAAWVVSLRAHAALHAVVLGGVTLAGLGLVDLEALAARIGLPVLAVTRRDSADSDLEAALRAAGLEDRITILRRAPRAIPTGDGLHATVVGLEPDDARALLAATVRKGHLPEPLRVAHLVARALVLGESRGRP